MEKSPLLHMASHAITASILGLMSGLIMGIAIQYISELITMKTLEEGPWMIAPFLGMSFGSLIGAILGGIVGINKGK